MHEDFDELFKPGRRKAKINEADILESKEVALDRIAKCETMFLVTCPKKNEEGKMEIVWLAPVTLAAAIRTLQGVEELRAAVFQTYLDAIDEEGAL